MKSSMLWLVSFAKVLCNVYFGRVSDWATGEGGVAEPANDYT